MGIGRRLLCNSKVIAHWGRKGQFKIQAGDGETFGRMSAGSGHVTGHSHKAL